MRSLYGHQPVYDVEGRSGGGPAAVKTEDLEAIKRQLEEISGQVSEFGKEFVEKLQRGEKISVELRESVDKALSDQGELRQRVLDLEQKAARGDRGGGGYTPPRTPGQIFVEDERVKQFCADRASRGRVRVDMPSLQVTHGEMATITSATASAGQLIVPQRLPGILDLPQRRLTVRDLLTPGRTNSNAIQYVRETGFTNAAAVVSEGVTKPQSNLTFDLVTKSVSTIAHWMLASKQVLDDAPALQSHIFGRLRYGLAFEEEDQLLNGDGTGVNLHGIIPQATAYAAAFAPTAVQNIDRVRLALLQAELALFPSTGIVLNPTDWARIELTKDSTGRYIFAQVQALAPPTLWSRPVVSTPAQGVGDLLVGAFQLGAQIFDREDANVEISTEDSDNFRKNLITLRAEERLGLAVYRPEAFIFGDNILT